MPKPKPRDILDLDEMETDPSLKGALSFMLRRSSEAETAPSSEANSVAQGIAPVGNSSVDSSSVPIEDQPEPRPKSSADEESPTERASKVTTLRLPPRTEQNNRLYDNSIP